MDTKKMSFVVAALIATILFAVGVSFPQEVRAGGDDGIDVDCKYADAFVLEPIEDSEGNVINGLFTKVQEVETSLRGNGEPCSPYEVVDYRGKTVQDTNQNSQVSVTPVSGTPVDCEILEWSKWVRYTKTEIRGLEREVRVPLKTRGPENGGKPCADKDLRLAEGTNQRPSTISQTSGTSFDCQYSGWTKPELLEGASSTYVSSPIITDGPKNGGEPCPKPEITTRNEVTPQTSLESPRKSDKDEWEITIGGFVHKCVQDESLDNLICGNGNGNRATIVPLNQPQHNVSSNQRTCCRETRQGYYRQSAPVRYEYRQPARVAYRDSHGSGRDSCFQGKGLGGALIGGAAFSNIGSGSGRAAMTALGALIGCESSR